MTFHASFIRRFFRVQNDTNWGIPLLFFETTGKTFAIVLGLKRRTSPHGDVIAECQISTITSSLDEREHLVRIVEMSRVRTSCLMVKNDDTFYVFTGGERVFRHLQ